MIGIYSKASNQVQPYDHITMGLCFSLLGGFLDSYSYLLKGNVFANAQTGNFVLLFIVLANKDYDKCLKYLIPIITFSLGILVAEALKKDEPLEDKKRMNTILILEALSVLCIAFFGKYFSYYVVNCLISFIAATQVASFDKINNNTIATTMITGNLKSSMIHLSRYLRKREAGNLISFFQYALLIISFGFGVIIGSIFIDLFSEYSILICELFIFVILFMVNVERKLTTGSSRFGARK
jgi:uncharacterized membrane protein YoaK (UPF0700 family)